MPEFEFISGDPDEIAAKMNEAHERHKDLHRMGMEEFYHACENMMDAMPDDALMFFSTFCSSMVQMEGNETSLAQFAVSAARKYAMRKNLCPVCLKNHDEEEAKVLSQPPMKVDPDNNTDVFGDELLRQMNAKEVERQTKLDEYGVVASPEPGDMRVGCKNCDMLYVSLADRMMKPPGVEGCMGCINKAKWGGSAG